MLRYTVKILLALGLAVLVYSIGMPGCSPTQFATVTPCSEFLAEFNCQSETVEGSLINIDPPQFGYDPPPPENKSDLRHDPTPKETNTSPAPSPQYMVFNYDVSLGQVDILFVIDNSSSMAIEHRNIANQLRSFLQRIREVNYHVAVITTDISSSPGNPVRNAVYQDGKFLPIGRRIFLKNENMGKNPPQQIVEAFKATITREETTRCDGRGNLSQPRISVSRFDRFYQNQESPKQCPSHDERAIYALNLAIQNPMHQTFFRPQAHMIIVILSDEDERSSSEYYNKLGFEHYALEPNDHPEVLVEKFHYRFGALKRFSVHSIIVPTGDTECLSEQNRMRSQGEGTGRGYYGVQYARLSNAEDPAITHYGNLVKGNVISICNRRYGAQLQKIAVAANTIRSPLPCESPIKVELYVSGRKTRASYKVEGRTLIMDPGEVPLNSRLKLKVTCKN